MRDDRAELQETSASLPAGARRTLLILTAVYGVNYVDRQILGILVEPIKRDLALSDTQMGILTGLAFALFYAGLGLPIARLAERIGRRTVIGVSVAIFACATTASAFVVSYAQLFLARMMVGVGEAGTTPASLSIISHLYPEKRRTGAMAVFTAGALIGLLVGFAIAGVVAARFGWRAGLLAAGIPGLVLAVLVSLFVVDNVPRTPSARPALGVVAGYVRLPSFWWLALSGGLPLFTSAAMSSWMPAYVQRAFGVDVAFVSILFGVGVGVIGTLTTLATGWLADRLHSPSNNRPLIMVGVGLVMASGCYLAALSSGSLVWFVAFLLPALGLSTVFQAPLLARVQMFAPVAERATLTALFMLVTSLLGLACGPYFVGAMSDRLGQGSAEGLRLALMLALVGNAAAIISLCALARQPRRLAVESPLVA